MKNIKLNQLEFETLLVSIKEDEHFIDEKTANEGVQNLVMFDEDGNRILMFILE